jgi:hypothetical protein
MKILVLLTALMLAPAAASAQGKPPDAKVDCSQFSKKADGSWFVNAQTTIELGDSQITIAAGDLGSRMMQFGMADLHTVLDNACPDQTGQPAPQFPKSIR